MCGLQETTRRERKQRKEADTTEKIKEPVLLVARITPARFASGEKAPSNTIPVVTPKQLDTWALQFDRFPLLARLQNCEEEENVDWVIMSATNGGDRSLLETLKKSSQSFKDFLSLVHICWPVPQIDAAVGQAFTTVKWCRRSRACKQSSNLEWNYQMRSIS
jgi:hypothetical protein